MIEGDLMHWFNEIVRHHNHSSLLLPPLLQIQMTVPHVFGGIVLLTSAWSRKDQVGSLHTSVAALGFRLLFCLGFFLMLLPSLIMGYTIASFIININSFCPIQAMSSLENACYFFCLHMKLEFSLFSFFSLQLLSITSEY